MSAPSRVVRPQYGREALAQFERCLYVMPDADLSSASIDSHCKYVIYCTPPTAQRVPVQLAANHWREHQCASRRFYVVAWANFCPMSPLMASPTGIEADRQVSPRRLIA